MKSFKKYVEKCKPFPWTLVREHPNDWLVGNNSLLISFVRFKLIMEAVKHYFSTGFTVLDVGVYPGIVPQLFHEYYPSVGDYRYYGLGLGFNDEFTEKMDEYGVKLLECDLDPRLNLNGKRVTSIPLEDETIDFVIFTDVIEHFFDPFYPLQEINRVSKIGATMILTTDNINRLGCLLDFLRGRGCNVPLIEGNLFYTGDWRPHFREYSRDELFQLLQWAGFEVLEHQFYEVEFGQYFVEKNILRKKDRLKRSFIGSIVNIIQKLAVPILPQLRDNHILVARKVKTYEEMRDTAPKVVSEIDEWHHQRQEFSK
jgi:ubiquinone/menaquinone biosynthesis C-methylase UbiE